MTGSGRFARAGLIAGFIAGALPATTHAYLYKEVRDWQVTCSNGLTCTLQYASPDAEGADLTGVGLERTAAPEAPVDLVLTLDLSSLGEAPLDGTLDVAVDGETTARLAVADAVIDDWSSQMRFTEAAEIEAALDAMKAGTEMELTLDLAGETSTLAVPLSGVTAGLLFMDEAQDRLERTDALQAVGTNPPRESALAREITSFDQIPEEIRAEFDEDTDICGGLDEARLGYGGGFRLDRGNGVELIGLPCGLGGAYNQPFALYATIGETFRPLDIPTMGEAGPSTTAFAYNLDVDPIAGEITAFFKGRGLGDCGGIERWSLGEDGQRVSLTLIEQRVKGECDGNFDDGPENWPLVWPERP